MSGESAGLDSCQAGVDDLTTSEKPAQYTLLLHTTNWQSTCNLLISELISSLVSPSRRNPLH